ncbi:DUF3097 domain-containing protein [Cellulomonas fimi]|uniref:DUF3097 domain-containing protein n=1 Tax=Cellulomonas fimi (strain ATCC 484 / DSM 20113 / JCM 1341 / CCUG 24087 / LMG 16345 / NBRC 15513 / NCIMB 8980 / NCTC 7547 / NRS-133) TaxID=590998 RepID=F4H2Y0_CELFA|nr:DUF3097 domain-containing protein [Cellulomonas fimi]AEE46479.1 hypothetical protein Celf_2352 [Cellulomonas fimi ATCC 484]NNH08233.1 DUF3097 domain-containing protein [Cellulomonas fimi]VEH33162.1 Protein of uncharacterised function (DUF3097) [Cellulomonas fimi]
MTQDRYGSDVLGGSGPAHHRPARTSQPQAADTGLVVEEVTSGWVGAVVRVEKSGGMHVVVLEDRRGRTRTFPLGPGFWVDGEPVELVAPVRTTAPARPTRTASGSRAVHGAAARVARGSRIWVEGKHDAELVEKVWGDDLRLEGVVVELLDGVDHLPDAVRAFAPGPGRRLGVLVDHLVPGSKESRIAAEVTRTAPAGTVLVLGHPYVDVWQAVRPQRVGLDRWPTIERGTEWKHGILRELGWPADEQADVARAWQRILGSVRSYADLEPSLLGRVEELIDFVTA